MHSGARAPQQMIPHAKQRSPRAAAKTCCSQKKKKKEMEDGTRGKIQVLDGDWLSHESLRKGASFTIEIIISDLSEGCADILEV